MANQTVKEAVYIKGTNPQYLVEKIIRTRIYDCRYWKEECFGLTAELLVDKAMELKSLGGIYSGNVKPTPFLCLVLKMLQIQPDKEIIIEFIKNEDFKYVRALGAFYMRLIANSIDVYKYLEPLYIDYRKMKRLNRNGKYELIHMDEFIDELIHGERVCDISLPRIQKRMILEDTNELETRVSPLDINLNELESSEDDEDEEEEEESSSSESEKSLDLKKKKNRGKSRSRSRDRRRRSRSKERRRRSRTRSRSRDNKRSSKSYKYVDYDNPSREDEEFYSGRRRRSRTRSRSRSRSRSRQRSTRDRRRSRTRSRSMEKKKSYKK